MQSRDVKLQWVLLCNWRGFKKKARPDAAKFPFLRLAHLSRANAFLTKTKVINQGNFCNDNKNYFTHCYCSKQNYYYLSKK